MTRFIFWIGIVLTLLVGLVFWRTAHAYDATFNFTQQYPELVSGWKIKAGPTKGGPYPIVIDCKKPSPNVDKSYDCVGTNLTVNPVYAVAVNYDSTGKEGAPSVEATSTITVPPPADVKIGVKITTISRLTSRGNVIASTTIKRIESDKPIVEGTKGYRNGRGEWVSNTVVALN